MPAAVVPITAGRRQGAYVLIEAHVPGKTPAPAGILLIDTATGQGYSRFRRQFDDLTDDTEVFDALAEDFDLKIREMGAEPFLASLEDSLSCTIRVSEREAVQVDSFTRVLDRLFDRYVEPVQIDKFRTHVPLQTLRAAAGGLGPEDLVESDEWVPLPARRRPSERLFAALVEGDSMEPLIPDGSLNLFSFDLQGSRQGKVVLIELFGSAAGSGRYSVKRYTSTKSVREDDWEHTAVTFVPHNHAHQPWHPRPEEFRIVAEWLCVIE
jgi:phage repressor protein C with HTH and peptisase S24 domain